MDTRERSLYMATFGVVAAGLMLLRLRRKRQERRIRALQQRNRRLVALLAARRSPTPEPKSPRRTGGAGRGGGVAGGAGRRRRIWARLRSDNFWQHVMSADFDAQDWLHNFHLSRATFEHARDLLRDHIATHDTAWRPATPVEKKVAVFLWRLCNNCHYKVLSQLFGVGRSSACLILKEAIQALILHVMPRVIKPCENTPSFFEEVYGLPGCHGVICSTYIPVSPPNYVKAEYAVPGQDDLYACLLQVVVGRDGQITAARAGQTPSRPGRLEDWAFVPELMASSEQDVASSSGADSTNAGHFAYLVADQSFPLRPEVLKPYDFAATKPQRTYNSALNGAIGYATQTMLKLKARWKCLAAKYEGDLSSVGDLALACCVLHNICEIKGDRFEPRWAEGITATHPASFHIPKVTDELLIKARVKRDALAIKLATRDV